MARGPQGYSLLLPLSGPGAPLRSAVLLSLAPIRSRTVRKVPYQPTNLPGQRSLSAKLHPLKECVKEGTNQPTHGGGVRDLSANLVKPRNADVASASKKYADGSRTGRRLSRARRGLSPMGRGQVATRRRPVAAVAIGSRLRGLGQTGSLARSATHLSYSFAPAIAPALA